MKILINKQIRHSVVYGTFIIMLKCTCLKLNLVNSCCIQLFSNFNHESESKKDKRVTQTLLKIKYLESYCKRKTFQKYQPAGLPSSLLAVSAFEPFSASIPFLFPNDQPSVQLTKSQRKAICN